MSILVATDREVVVVDVERGATAPAHGIGDRPTCLAADPLVHGRAWCGTHRGGVFRSDDGGRSWQPVGLAGQLIMAVTASPAERDVVWVGTEPSEVWRSEDAGHDVGADQQVGDAVVVVRNGRFRRDRTRITCAGSRATRSSRNDCWVAIEAGALVSTIDGGRTWRDRVPGGPWDTHELAIHPKAPDTLRVSAGDGYFESDDAGATWRSPSAGLEVGYLRSVAIDSGATGGRRGISVVRTALRVRRRPLGWPVVSPSHSRALGARARRLAGASQHHRTSALRRRERRRVVGRG